MAYLYLPLPKKETLKDKLPWLFFGVVATTLFVILHSPMLIHESIQDYNAVREVTLAGLDGSSFREAMLVVLGLFAAASLAKRPAATKLRIASPIAWLLIAFTVWS